MSDWSSIDSVLQDSRSFIAPWEAKLRTLGGSQGTSLNNAVEAAKERSSIRSIILGPPDSLKEFACCVEKWTAELVRKNSRRCRGYLEIDLVNNIAISAWTNSVAHLLGIPLKSPSAPQAVLDCEALQEKLVALFRYIFSFSKLDSMQELPLRRSAVEANEQLSKVISEVCEAIKCSSFAHILLHRHRRDSPDELMSEHGSELLQRLFESGKTVKEVVDLVALLAVQIAIPSAFAVSHPRAFSELAQ